MVWISKAIPASLQWMRFMWIKTKSTRAFWRANMWSPPSFVTSLSEKSTSKCTSLLGFILESCSPLVYSKSDGTVDVLRFNCPTFHSLPLTRNWLPYVWHWNGTVCSRTFRLGLLFLHSSTSFQFFLCLWNKWKTTAFKMLKRFKPEKWTRMNYKRSFMFEGKTIWMLQNFHVRKLPTWLTDHGSLLTVPFVLCLNLRALSSLALIALFVSCEPWAVLTR